MQTQRLLLFGLLAGSMLLTACDKPPPTQQGEGAGPVQNSTTSAPQARSENIIGRRLAGDDNNVVPQATAIKELQWEELIPAEWRPDPDLVFKYNNGEISDKDPRIIALKIKIEKMEKLAPVNKKLNGKQIKLPGFVVPLEGDAKAISEFLLVPYHGACIHVPPPPPNQIVFVRSRDGSSTERKLMETVWVTDTMKIEKVKSKVAEAGYTLIADSIETYD